MQLSAHCFDSVENEDIFDLPTHMFGPYPDLFIAEIRNRSRRRKSRA